MKIKYENKNSQPNGQRRVERKTRAQSKSQRMERRDTQPSPVLVCTTLNSHCARDPDNPLPTPYHPLPYTSPPVGMGVWGTKGGRGMRDKGVEGMEDKRIRGMGEGGGGEREEDNLDDKRKS